MESSSASSLLDAMMMAETMAPSTSTPSAAASEFFSADAAPSSLMSAPSLLNFTLPPREECEGLNASCACYVEYQFYEWPERLLLGLIALPIIAFGLCANLTSIRIFTHRLMSSSSINWYLAVLSVSDCLILLASFFVLSLPRFGEFLTVWKANYVSYAVTPYMYGMMMAAQTTSVWLTVGVSVHRYIGVCHPYKSMQLLPKKRVASFICFIILFSILFNSTRLFEVHVSNVCYRYNIDYLLPSLQPTPLRISYAYRLIFFGWAYTMVMFAFPFSMLIVLNSMVLYAVRRSRRMHAVACSASDNDEFGRRAERKERQTSIMLIAVVLLFLCCNSLAFVVNIMENLGNDDSSLYSVFVTISNLLVIINASCNICVYMLFSEKYRLLLRHFLCCEWSRPGDLLINSVVA